MSDQDVHDAAMLVDLLRARTPAMGPEDDDDEDDELGEEGKQEPQVARGGQDGGHHYGV